MIPPTGAVQLYRRGIVYSGVAMRVSLARVHFRRGIEIKGWSRCFDIQMDDLYEANPDILSLTRGRAEKERSECADSHRSEEISMVHLMSHVVLQ